MSERNTALTDEIIMTKIYIIRGQKVMLDIDLAILYNVETRALKQAVKRNSGRFPEDFCFQLTKQEWQEVITKCDKLSSTAKFSPATPIAFLESGVAMLSSVLNSELAIKVNIQIIRIFTRMREMWLTHKDILLKLEELENKVTGHDQDIQTIFQYLKELLNPPQPPRRRIGFNVKDED